MFSIRGLGLNWAGRQSIGGEVGRGLVLPRAPAAGPGRRAGFFGCYFACVSLVFWFFWLLFGSGCWASCCFFFSAGFFGCSFACVSHVFRVFLVTFLGVGAGRRAALFSRRAFLGVLLLVFLLFFGFF